MRKIHKIILVSGVAFSALAIGLGYGYHHYLQNNKTANASLQTAIIHSTPVTDTKTGLLLAGMTAQKRRDWGEAWQSFSALNDQYLDNPDIALRAFTLAVGNGDFDEALAIAKPISNDLFNQKQDGELSAPQYDLMRLFLILSSIKDNHYDTAKSQLDVLSDSAMVQFSKPILNAWITAEISPDDFQINQKNLNPLQLFYIALAGEKTGNIDMAINVMGQISSDILVPEKMAYMALFFHRNGEEEKSKKTLNQLIIKFPDSKTLTSVQSQINNNTAQTTPHNDYEIHLKGAPYALSMAYHDFANLLINERAVDSGLLFARMASFLAPDDQSIYMTIGGILSYQKQDKAAMDAYGKISSHHPQYERAVTEVVSLLETSNDYDRALGLVNIAIETTKTPENAYFHYLKGNILNALKQYDAALTAYNTTENYARKLHENSELPRKYWPLHYSRAVTYDLLDQWDAAEADMLLALEKYPDNPIILNYLGYGYADRDINLDKALDMLSLAVTGAPNDPYIIDSMGWILYRTNDYDRAVHYLELAASINPYHMVINDHLGDAYWQTGRKLEAHYMWQRALDYYDAGDEEQRRMIDDTKEKVKNGLISTSSDTPIEKK